VSTIGINSKYPRRYEGFNEPGYTTLKKSSEMAYGGQPPIQVLMVRKTFLKEHPEVVEKLLEAHVDATDWIKNNRQKTADIIAQESANYLNGIKRPDAITPKAVNDELYKNLPVDVYPNLQFANDIWGNMEKYNAKKPFPMKDVVDFQPWRRC
jgi:ABC-type nitrate/sulfonate/bicarbonate transport system substrate-binding protein